MGNLGSKATRPVRNFNIEQRTEATLEKAKEVPRTAPRHKTTEKLLADFAREHPELLESQNERNEDLLERLKLMKIESSGTLPEIKAKTLPQERRQLPDTDFGYFEPEVIPDGKTTIRKVTELISQHSSDPQKYSAQVLAKGHKLDIGLTEDVLKHFKVFNLYLPKKPTKGTGRDETLEAGEHIQLGQQKISPGDEK